MRPDESPAPRACGSEDTQINFIAPRFAGAPSAWLDVHKPNERAIGADLIARFNIIDDAIAGIGGGGGCVMDDSLLGMDP